MKSILVDALRQANGKEPDATLSDSGSFDATEADFGPTANDEEVVPLDSQDENLELMQTSAFHADDLDPDHNADLDEEVEIEADVNPSEQALALTTSVDVTLFSPKQDSATAPILARFLPLVCIVLAAISATGWAVYQQFATVDRDRGLGATEMPFRPGDGLSSAADAPSSAGRFPFIEARVDKDDGATTE